MMSSQKINQPKILLYDIEVSRAIWEGYGTKWEFKPIKQVRPQLLMSFSWKYLGEKKIHFHHMHGYKTYKEFVESLSKTLGQASVVVAHNGVNFDDKMSNTFFITEGVELPAPYKSVDTCRIARQKLKFPSNSLNDLGEYLGVGQKEKITYADIEDDFMSDSPSRKSIKQMEKYNNKDVQLLEDVYLKLRPLMANHPNMGVRGDVEGCPKCGSHDRQYRGYTYSNTMTYRSIYCKTCGGWYKERAADKDIQNKPEYAN